MIVPYLHTNKLIQAEKGNFRIREIEEGYELWREPYRKWYKPWKKNPPKLVLTRSRINDLRDAIGKVYRIG